MNKILDKVFPKKFGNFFRNIKNKENLDKDLIYFSEVFINSESYKYVSNQWHLLNIIDYKNILKSGTNNLGIETFGHYFNFFDYEDKYLTNLFKNFNEDETITLKSNFFKKHKDLDFKKSSNYNYLILLLYSNLRKSSYFKYLNLLKDETYLSFGNPFITIEDQNITSDKIVSLFDLEHIDNFHFIDKKKILEIGAGSGRLTECILSTKNILNYTICDIPPSIFINYKRLKLAFPKKKIKILIDIENSEDLNKEISNNDISFIFPHQIKKIKENMYDLTIAIDCLHEMDKSTLKYYFKNISIISKNFYFSVWEKTKNWASGGVIKKTERLDFNKGDYQVPSDWKEIYKKNLLFPSNQIGLGYLLNK